MSLQVFNNDGLELIINNETGEAFATIKGYARMSGKDKSTISRRLKGVASNDIKTAEVLTTGGLQGVALIPADTVFLWLMKDNPELAVKMGTVGATVYLHQLAGYKVTSTAVKPKPMTQAELMLGLAQEIVNLEKTQLEQQKLLTEHASRLEAIEHHTSGYEGYMTLKAFCNVEDIDMTKFNPSLTGKLITKYAKEQGVEVKRVADGKYGEINSYPIELLKDYFTTT